MMTATSHFLNKWCASSYYRKQDPTHTAKDTEAKIKAGEITIGRPKLDKKFHLFPDGDGRWCYIEYENRKAVKS